MNHRKAKTSSWNMDPTRSQNPEIPRSRSPPRDTYLGRSRSKAWGKSWYPAMLVDSKPYTLESDRLEPENHLFEKEHHLKQTFIVGFKNVNFQGCSKTLLTTHTFDWLKRRFWLECQEIRASKHMKHCYHFTSCWMVHDVDVDISWMKRLESQVSLEGFQGYPAYLLGFKAKRTIKISSLPKFASVPRVVTWVQTHSLMRGINHGSQILQTNLPSVNSWYGHQK